MAASMWEREDEGCFYLRWKKIWQGAMQKGDGGECFFAFSIKNQEKSIKRTNTCLVKKKKVEDGTHLLD